jgi:diaminohydroxyphosphoribosylaminopyrimidine deaminase / 5-amino-6-(5-phosphoribosylamino)uracil reductase
MLPGNPTDGRFMSLALALGRRGLGRVWPNPAVGAVIVRADEGGARIVGRGLTAAGGRPHAETEALRRAGAAARGATMYVTLEPCSHHGRTPPCADAIVAAGIARVVSALDDPDPRVAGQGHARLRAAGLTVEVGLGAQEARRAHAGHIRRVTDGRPHVTLKLAVSADGKVGAPGRRPLAITGEAARARAHLLRAQNDAILVGIGTVLADDPQLTCRLPGMETRSPVRIVLDAGLRTPRDGKLVREARITPLWIVAGQEVPSAAAQALQASGAEVIPVDARAGRVDLPAAMRELGRRGITRLLVEGGPIVAAALLAADLIDEAVLFRSPMIVGADGIDALEGMPLTALTARLHAAGVETAGTDMVEFFVRA